VEFAHAFDGQVLATTLNGKFIYTVDMTLPTAIAIGNEGNGLSEALQEAATYQVTIPIAGVESLNAAAATSICLFERVRQKL
jgi:TrmH family RNA methyltransferase